MCEFANIFYLSSLDIGLLVSCPVLGAVASLIRAISAETNLERLPEFKQVEKSEKVELIQPPDNARSRSYAVFVMLLAGAAVGLGVALLFLGALQPQASAVGRVWFLSLILGFTTPKVLAHVQVQVGKTLKPKAASLLPKNEP